jgi:hypothetical protein
MEKVKVRFLKPHKMFIEGREVFFRESEIVEIDQETALRLFQEKLVLPGPEFGGVVTNRFEV